MVSFSSGSDDPPGTGGIDQAPDVDARVGSGSPTLTRGIPGTSPHAPELSFDDAVARLNSALQFGIHPSLDGIRALSAALGNPQDDYQCVQVAGTNGKTSVARMTAAILRAHGLRVGLYTSPHLVSYTERIEIDGTPAAEAEFARALENALLAARISNHRAAETLGVSAEELDGAFTEFELLTAAALWLFRELRVDWGVLEVGMGARWDATSVVEPAVSVVTGVSLDHTERLGTTREDIAADKAYAIKSGSRAVLGPGCGGVEQIFFDRALALGVPTVRVGLSEHDVTWRVLTTPDAPGGSTRLDVIGACGQYQGLEMRAPSYQAPNLATAVAAAELALGRTLDLAAVRQATDDLRLPGRFELLRAEPPLVIDGAHNAEAAGVLAGAIAEAFGGALPTVVLGVLADKDAAGIVRALAPVAARFVCTQPDSPRARPATALAEIVHAATGVRPEVAERVSDALAATALEGAIVTGSLYMAGEARAILLD